MKVPLSTWMKRFLKLMPNGELQMGHFCKQIKFQLCADHCTFLKKYTEVPIDYWSP